MINFYLDSYFALPQPKSTGREYFNRELIKKYLDNEIINDFDLIATGGLEKSLKLFELEQVTSLTTESIIREVQKLNSARSLNVFGGGARNQVIMETLRKRLPSLEGKKRKYTIIIFYSIRG